MISFLNTILCTILENFIRPLQDLICFWNLLPRDKSLGYFRMSLMGQLSCPEGTPVERDGTNLFFIN
jgi:hypothetical protein